MILVCLSAFGMRGLYRLKGFEPVEELRRLTGATSMVYLSLIAFTFLEHVAQEYSRMVFIAAWLLSIVLLPLSREAIRRLAGHRPWWGTPTVVIGSGTAARAVLHTLKNEPGRGIRVQCIFGQNENSGDIQGVPIVGNVEHAPELTRKSGITTAIVAMPDIPGVSLSEIVGKFGKHFSDLLIVPDTRSHASLYMESSGVGNLVTLGVRQDLLLQGPRLCKRAIDLLLASVGAGLIMPVILVAAAAIKLTSRGPIFYGQLRIGRNQQFFRAWKFRTMVKNADRTLADCLARDTDLQREWEKDHKLRNDPRVTSVGRFLRKWSLDELPQLWNVIRGEMSLVGPRPIVWAEVPRYAARFEVYARVTPGITGLWQVSGRNDTDYERRVDLDAFYVHNWSLWLDLYILIRTFFVVLDRKGAY
jgi:Undecaprenyl-phosphate galactose phosphotransferase WbaP